MSKKREPIKLKPCPFCGSEKTIKDHIGGGIGGELWWVTCETCGAAIGPRGQAGEAIAAWNLRTEKALEHDTT